MDGLKKEITDSWKALDADGDGTIEAEDLMKLFDTDGDGVLSMKEMTKLAAQLAHQVDMNNKLLSQVSTLELAQLNYQREAKDKAAALLKALKVCDAVGVEAASLKSRLAEAERKQAEAIAAAHAAKVEAGIKAQEARENEEEAAAARNYVANMQARLAEVSKALTSEATSDKAKLADAMVAIERERAEKVALAIEISAKVESLAAAEKAAVVQKAAFDDLNKKFKALQAKCSTSTAASSAAETRIEELEALLASSRAAEGDAKAAAAAASTKATRVEERLAPLMSALAVKETELNSVKLSLEQVTGRVRNALDAAAETEAKMESVKKSAQAEVKALVSEAKKATEALNAMKSHVESLEHAAKENDERHAKETARLTESFAAARKTPEEDYKKLRQEFNDLTRLQDKTQTNLAEALAATAALTLKVEAEKAAEKKRKENEKGLADGSASRASKTIETLEAQLKQCRMEMASRTQRHIHILAALQANLKQLAAEAKEARESRHGIADELNSFKEKLASYIASDTLHDDWNAGVKKAVEKLLEETSRLNGEKQRAVSTAEKERAKLLEHEREVTELRENVSKISSELSTATSKLSALQRDTESRVRSATASVAAETQLRHDAQEQLGRVKLELEASQKQLKVLKDDMIKQSGIQTEKLRALDARMVEAQAEVANLMEENEHLRKSSGMTVEERGALESKLREAINMQATLRNDLRKAQGEAVSKDEEVRAKEATFSNHIKGLNDGMKKFQTQLQETQKLLGIVQEQRELLQADNLHLRSELDEVYAKALLRNEDDDDEKHEHAGAAAVAIATAGTTRDLRIASKPGRK